MTPDLEKVLSPMRWHDGVLELLDQRLLPHEETWVQCRDYRAVARAIKEMVVRGAPAIGCAAAYGVALGARQKEPLDKVVAVLRATGGSNVSVLEYHDQGHNLHRTAYERFATDLEHFLERIL